MAGNSLENIRIAIIVTDGFEQIELVSPRNVLANEGAVVHLLAPTEREELRTVQGYNHISPADRFEIDSTVEEASPEDYEAVFLPGGVVNADRLRSYESVLNFLRDMNDADKPVIAICHGPWAMVSAGIVKGRRMTSYHTIKDDLINAGAVWLDEPVVIDDNFITSRHPGDLEKFNSAIVDALARLDVEAMHAEAIDAMEMGGS